MSEAVPNLVCRRCISMLKQASELKEMLHSTAIFWETFLMQEPKIVEISAPTPTVMIKKELDEDFLLRETIYVSSSYYEDADDKDEIVLQTADSDVEDEIAADDSKPNVLNCPVKKEPGFCEICYTGKISHSVRIIQRFNIFFC